MQADILDGCPDDSQATHLGSEHVNLIGALPHEAPQTLDGIGGLNMPMYSRRKVFSSSSAKLRTASGYRLLYLASARS